jgi:hypothetical protein
MNHGVISLTTNIYKTIQKITVDLTSKSHLKFKEHFLVIFKKNNSRSGPDVCPIWQQTPDHGLSSYNDKKYCSKDVCIS